MKVNVSNELKQLNGQPLVENDNGEAVPVTFKDVIANALLSPVQKEKGVEYSCLPDSTSGLLLYQVP